MPPKRKTPAAPKAPSKRRSALAKQNDISASQEAEIQDAFHLFSPDSQRIARADIKRCLVALNAPPPQAALNELLDEADEWVSYENFFEIAALSLNSREEEDKQEEVLEAYRLFTRGDEREIRLEDLRRVAAEIREEVPESVLRDMVREATGGGLVGVGVEEFEGVMRRAGVFS